MLVFRQNDTAAPMYLTLTEMVTISAPYFLFTFKHVTTSAEVAFVKNSADDESPYPERYNQFTIDPSVLFANQLPGEWHYEVREQASSSNVDPELSGAVIEVGKLDLERAEDFEFQQYHSDTSFKAYNG